MRMLLNCMRNRMNGPRLRPSGNLLGPYVSSRLSTSEKERPDCRLLSKRRSTSSAAIACQGIEPGPGVLFATVVIGVLRGSHVHQSSTNRHSQRSEELLRPSSVKY